MLKDFDVLVIAARPWEAEWIWVSVSRVNICDWILETGKVCVSPRGGTTVVVLPFSCSVVLGQSNGVLI